MEKIRAIVDRQESRKETGMGLGMSMILNLLAVIFLSAKGEE